MIYPQSYVDHESLLDLIKNNYDFWQLKYDGIWDRCVIRKGIANHYSKTGLCKDSNPTTFPDCVLIGEYMYGSEWAQHPERVGKFYVFDIESFGEQMLETFDYRERYTTMRNRLFNEGATKDPNILLAPNYGLSQLESVWERIVSGALDYEGIICRRWSDTLDSSIGRLKPFITDDVVIMDAYEGKEGKCKNMLGGFKVGKFKQGSGQLTYLYSVGGGFSDPERKKFWSEWPVMQGRVIECYGRKRFASGALRHPNFKRIRDDKLASQCVMLQKT